MKVSVCMIVYNHEKYIAQALESILMQKTRFDYEIVIGDDGSTDSTQAICEKYAANNPGKIRYIRHEKNIGMMPNLISTMQVCQGEYLAILEGDDFWTDDQKLQLQSDFLDSHKEHSLCCHLHWVLAKGRLIPMHTDLGKDVMDVTTEEYMLNPFFHTTSYFFRRTAQPQPYPDWYYKVLAGDHFLVLFLSMKGKIGCLNRRMSVFRNHGSSVSFTRTALELKNNFVKHLRKFDEYSEGRYRDTIRQIIQRWDLVYKVYEPANYFRKFAYFTRNVPFYLRHFKAVGGFKLFLKYLIPQAILQKIK